jgi:phospholipid/cholesterol/gamma-HCH transport system substrate-binding protein
VVMALIVLTLAFIIWLANVTGASAQHFDIFFKQVDGLAKGSVVTYSGVPTGKVEEIRLMPDKPEFVRVRIAVDEDVPILQGTTATIAGVGFTGVSQINLDGAVRNAQPITTPGEYGVPVIPTRPGAIGQLLSSAPELLDKVSTLVDRLGLLLDPRNRNSIGNILANVDRLSGSLADRGPEIAATLAETRVAVRQAGTAAEQIGRLAASADVVVQRDVAPTMASFRQAAASAQRSMANLDAAIADARPGLQSFSKQTVPEVGLLVRDLREMSEALTAVAGRLDRGGATGLIGGSTLPDYEGK